MSCPFDIAQHPAFLCQLVRYPPTWAGRRSRLKKMGLDLGISHSQFAPAIDLSRQPQPLHTPSSGEHPTRRPQLFPKLIRRFPSNSSPNHSNPAPRAPPSAAGTPSVPGLVPLAARRRNARREGTRGWLVRKEWAGRPMTGGTLDRAGLGLRFAGPKNQTLGPGPVGRTGRRRVVPRHAPSGTSPERGVKKEL